MTRKKTELKESVKTECSDPSTHMYDYKNYCNINLKTEKQRVAFSLFKNVDYLFLIGPAGVGKSFVAAALAIREVVNKRAGSIILTRPIVEAEESLGYLPGTFGEKISPYMRPILRQFREVFSEEEPRKQFEHRFTELLPLAYMRGETFNNAICILDEGQNANYRQFKMYLTRLGHNSKMIITGDPDQCDISNSGLMETIAKCSHRNSVGVVTFDNHDNVRHESVEYMLKDLS